MTLGSGNAVPFVTVPPRSGWLVKEPVTAVNVTLVPALTRTHAGAYESFEDPAGKSIVTAAWPVMSSAVLSSQPFTTVGSPPPVPVLALLLDALASPLLEELAAPPSPLLVVDATLDPPAPPLEPPDDDVVVAADTLAVDAREPPEPDEADDAVVP